MKRGTRPWLAALPAAVLLALAGCSGGGGEEEDEEEAKPASVTLQLPGVIQGRFAGYYAAAAQGYYEDESLEVEIRAGGPGIAPEQVVLGGEAEFGVNWLDATLATRDRGGRIVNLAQVFARSGTTEVTWKDSGLDRIEELEGRRVGAWLGSSEHKLFAALARAGLDPQRDVVLVAQPFDMNLFLNREVDAAMAMTYNELAHVLETRNPETGELHTLDELNVMRMSDLGTGTLEDGVFVAEEWLADEANQDVARRFLEASFRGWIHCRDHPEDCVRHVLDAAPTLGESHQRWMVNEASKLIWPNEHGIGVMDEADYDLTVRLATEWDVVANDPGEGVFVTDYAEAAVQELADEGVDVTGEGWEAPSVELVEGGE